MVKSKGETVKVRLVKNWRKLHKSFTVIMSILGFIVGVIEVVLPQMGLIQPFLDPATYGILMFTMTVAIGVGRYIQQDSLVNQNDSTKEGNENVESNRET